MPVDVRIIEESEFPDFVRAMFWAAGRPVDDAFVRERRRATDLAHALGLFEDGRLVGTLGMRKLTMRLPGGTVAPLAALGQGGVMPGHTVQGHSRRMVMHLMGRAREEGFAIAGGTMAEWPGFGRFGWGPATVARSTSIETKRARFRTDLAFEETSRVSLVGPAEALALFPVLHAKSATNLVARDQAYWSVVVERLGRGESLDVLDYGAKCAPPFYAVHHDATGTADGIVAYRIDPKWKRGLSRTELEILFLVHATDAAHAGLWKHVLSLAHVERVHMPHGPADDALPWLLVDGRRVEVRGEVDHIWLRILDVPKAFRQRGCGLLEKPLVLRTRDDQFGETRTVRLLPNADGSLDVEETSASPDVEANVSVLASLFLGGSSLHPFVATKAIVHRSTHALRALASLFAETTRPFVDTEF